MTTDHDPVDRQDLPSGRSASRTRRALVPLLLALALPAALTACGSSDARDGAEPADAATTAPENDPTGAAAGPEVDPWATAPSRAGEEGERYPLSLDVADAHAAVTLRELSASPDAEVPPSHVGIAAALRLESDATAAVTVTVACGDEPAPTASIVEAPWATAMSGGVVELDAGTDEDGTVVVAAPVDCQVPTLQVWLTTANGAVASKGDEGPVAWPIPADLVSG